MNVLTDFHHGALLRSIFYLFTDRLGFNLDVIDIKTGNYLSEKMGVRSAFSNFLPQNFEKQTSDVSLYTLLSTNQAYLMATQSSPPR